jgi:hypothetical protein
MNSSKAPCFILLLSPFLILCAGLIACTPKKLSSNYGDNKAYADEDSTGRPLRIKEKQAKMPFDTGTVAPKIQTLQPKYDNQ